MITVTMSRQTQVILLTLGEILLDNASEDDLQKESHVKLKEALAKLYASTNEDVEMTKEEFAALKALQMIIDGE